MIEWHFFLHFFPIVIMDLKIRPRDLAEGFRLITSNVPQEPGLNSTITNRKNDWLIRIALLHLGWIEIFMLKENIEEPFIAPLT